ncbi:unnamed protein product [Miscanthus lutarioriparius]|uniref:Uncharacterized protein n=1 Tax=Miscanthus lutarioriparius TaxID=422564 RepID=A0A811RDA7_9POAL|nr:unnamed protein product [Miscanthus lutarioriparius]
MVIALLYTYRQARRRLRRRPRRLAPPFVGHGLVPASLYLSWDAAQYLDFGDSSSLHLLLSSPSSSTPSAPPHSACREACPNAKGISADHRPANRGRSSEKDSEGKRRRAHAFAIAAALVVVVVVVSPLALGSGLSRAWASIYSASVTRPRRGGDHRPRRRGAGLHTEVEEAGPTDGSKDYDLGSRGSTLSDPQPPPAPFPPPPAPAKVLSQFRYVRRSIEKLNTSRGTEGNNNLLKCGQTCTNELRMPFGRSISPVVNLS